MRRTGCAVVVAVVIAACEHVQQVPRPRVPQIEQANEALQSGGERYRAHRACTNGATSVDGLIGCMQDSGWEFVPHAATQPESDCWLSRDRGDVDHLVALCFQRGPNRPTNPTRAAP